MGIENKRGENRLTIKLEVELEIEGEVTSLHTRDLSNNGAYVEANDRRLPAVGSTLYLKLKQGLQEGETPVVKAQVVRADHDGFALKFVDD